MIEIFKDVKGYEGLYQVSNIGRVKSLNKELVMTPENTIYGYHRVRLYKQGKRKWFFIHQLVAVAFLNHTICGHKLVINHIDFDKTNNNISNLEIVTSRVNGNQKHIKSSSIYVGVDWHSAKNKWRSRIHIGGKRISLGSYTNEVDAHNAYQKALNDLESA
jgi:hypothetical protein